MKHLFLVFVFPFLISTQIRIEHNLEVEQHYTIEAAKTIAKKQNKNILVYFSGSDWCPLYKMLKKEFFDTTEFDDEPQNYILVYVYMPRSKKVLS